MITTAHSRLTRGCLGFGLSLCISACNAAASSWPAWNGFKSAFISADGRVVDHSQDDLRTVSEGQAYALFFSLLAKDQTSFDSILQWTENNLSDGDLGKNLPAWLWGKQGERWGVMDRTSASDADLWLVYTLLEASRVWCQPAYAEKARALGKLILEKETLEVAGLGLSVLPGNNGFVQENGAVKLNPSYVPPFLMARLAHVWADEPRWAQIYLASQRLLLESGRNGAYPDWVLFNNGLISLPVDELRGDYDAIRTYMWIGMTDSGDPLLQPLLRQLKPTLNLLQSRQSMPEWIEPQTGMTSADKGPAGFQIAVTPFLQASGTPALARQLSTFKLNPADRKAWLDYGYYNSALSLFGQGYADQLYRFNSLGELMPKGKEVKPCG